MTCEQLMTNQNSLLQTVVDSNNSIVKLMSEFIAELKKLNKVIGV